MQHDISVSHLQPPAIPQTPDKQRITARVRKAIEAMVWQGLQRRDAAAHAGLAEHSLYQALRRPPVRSLYLSELDVLRTSERARNIHTLAEVRDQQTNQMARVQAVKALEQLDDSPQAGTTRHQLPGFVIVVNNAPANGPLAQGDAKPLISLDPVREGD